MRLYSNIPRTWQDFEREIAKYLDECGYKVEVEKTLMTVRGSIEVDVYVETGDPLFESFICECKFWDTPVTKEKVLAFRSVVQDVGSPFGILLSKSGFQSGAIEAAMKSNVMLLTFDEFITRIADRWLESKFDKLSKKSAILSIYSDPLDIPYDEIKETMKSEYIETTSKFLPVYLTARSISTSDFSRQGVEFYPNQNSNLYLIEKFNSITDYVSFLDSEIAKAIIEYERILDGVKIDEYKIEALDSYAKIARFIK